MKAKPDFLTQPSPTGKMEQLYACGLVAFPTHTAATPGARELFRAQKCSGRTIRIEG